MAIVHESVAWMTARCPSTEDVVRFFERHGLDITVRDRGPDTKRFRYYATVGKAEVKRDGMLLGVSGNGNTPDEAVADYAILLSNEMIVLCAYTPERREIRAPELTYLQAVPAPAHHLTAIRTLPF